METPLMTTIFCVNSSAQCISIDCVKFSGQICDVQENNLADGRRLAGVVVVDPNEGTGLNSSATVRVANGLYMSPLFLPVTYVARFFYFLSLVRSLRTYAIQIHFSSFLFHLMFLYNNVFVPVIWTLCPRTQTDYSQTTSHVGGNYTCFSRLQNCDGARARHVLPADVHRFSILASKGRFWTRNSLVSSI